MAIDHLHRGECAFVLSFGALRSLAVTLGLSESIAWLWPCAIDVAIAQARAAAASDQRARQTGRRNRSLSAGGVIASYLPVGGGRFRAPNAAFNHGNTYRAVWLREAERNQLIANLR
ncbi:DUF2637 domain-containing protein [Mycolicibacterium moriokaense]|nr:DUF2637 domain-containing protein [Mycolicibacterium moriokaense]